MSLERQDESLRKGEILDEIDPMEGGGSYLYVDIRFVISSTLNRFYWQCRAEGIQVNEDDLPDVLEKIYSMEKFDEEELRKSHNDFEVLVHAFFMENRIHDQNADSDVLNPDEFRMLINEYDQIAMELAKHDVDFEHVNKALREKSEGVFNSVMEYYGDDLDPMQFDVCNSVRLLCDEYTERALRKFRAFSNPNAYAESLLRTIDSLYETYVAVVSSKEFDEFVLGMFSNQREFIVKYANFMRSTILERYPDFVVWDEDCIDPEIVLRGVIRFYGLLRSKDAKGGN